VGWRILAFTGQMLAMLIGNKQAIAIVIDTQAFEQALVAFAQVASRLSWYQS
jgi:hypothetical protein